MVAKELVLPKNATVVPLEGRLLRICTPGVPDDWYGRAVSVLRGGDGGEHGALLYKLTRAALFNESPVVVVDVGTARGFSAMVMARALQDADAAGTVYSIDTVGQADVVDWHGAKHPPEDPLAGQPISRAEIWERWFPEDRSSVVAVKGRSVDVLRKWGCGPISIAFLDGSHAYADVSQELALLDGLITETGVVVVDDYHVGEIVGRVRSRAVNLVAWVLGRAIGSSYRNVVNFAPRLGESNDYRLVKQRFVGVRRAVDEFVKNRDDWSLEAVSMPNRGDYQGLDYSLAILTRRSWHCG